MMFWSILLLSVFAVHGARVELDCEDRLDIIDRSAWPELPQSYRGRNLLDDAVNAAVGYTQGSVHAVLHTTDKRTYIRGSSSRYHLYGSGMTREVIELRGMQVSDIQIRSSLIAIHTSDGIVWTAGANDYGQLGHHGTMDRPIFSPVENISLVKQLAMGDQHGVALTRNGKLMSWGSNTYQQLGRHTSSNISPIPQQLTLGPVTSLPKFLCCGWAQCAAFTENMALLTWGYSNHIGRSGNNTTPGLVQGIPTTQNITKVSCGRQHTVALAESGELYGWGRNEYGEQVGVPNYARHASMLDLGERIVRDAVAGYYMTVIRTYSSVGEYFGHYNGNVVRTPQLATTVEYSRDVMHGSINRPNTWGTVRLGCPTN